MNGKISPRLEAILQDPEARKRFQVKERSPIETWDEGPIDDLRTRIAELEQYARDCRRYCKAVEYTFAAFPPERRAAHLGLRAAELAKRGDALLPKEVASGT